MTLFRDKVTLRFVAGIALPAIIVLGGAAAAVLISLDQMAQSVNTTELSLTRQSAEAALASVTRRVRESVGDYAHWDEAVTGLTGTPDTHFVDDNLVASTASPVFFDTAFLIEGDGRDVLGFHEGQAVAAPSPEVFGPSLSSMLAGLPRDGRTYEALSAIVRGTWGLMAIAAAPIVPTSADFAVDPSNTRFLVIGKMLDAQAVEDLGVNYVINGLALETHPVRSEMSVPIKDFDGTVIGSLTWAPRHLGSAARARVSPLAVSMLVLLGLTMLALAATAILSLARVRRSEQGAQYAATHDTLTGLPNRTSLVERLQSAIIAMRRGGVSVAVAYLDLDGFKEVNDTYGHEIGDALLRHVAADFQRLVAGSLLVRLGGDEFAVVVEGADATASAVEIGGRLVDYFGERFLIEGRTIALSTSVGIVAVDSIGISVDELLRRADVAMYQAKQLGRDRVCIYNRSLDAVRIHRIEIAADLRRALQTGGLLVAYQPVVDAGTGLTVGVEALLRWPNPPDGPIGPAEFIPIAEETDLIDEIGLWTLHRACTDALPWRDIKVAVNASPAQFRNPNFAGEVAGVLREVGFPAARLEIEITETYLVAHPEQARTAIDALRALGVSVSLDDFGTGYSSIGYLRRFAFDKLKVDRSLVADIDTSPHARDLMQATVHLARALGLAVTAEGVETESEAIILRAAGCQTFQGYFFARPGPPMAVAARLARERAGLAMAG